MVHLDNYHHISRVIKHCPPTFLFLLEAQSLSQDMVIIYSHYPFTHKSNHLFVFNGPYTSALFQRHQWKISRYILKVMLRIFVDELIRGMRKGEKPRVMLRILACATE